MNKDSLNNYSKKIFSQFGEDGIILEILNRLTKKNLDFCLTLDPQNSYLKKRAHDINLKLKNHQPTVPITLEEELKTNIFLRCSDENIKLALNQKGSTDQEIFTKLRELKDTF